MNCSNNEQKLYLLSDGLLDDEEKAALLTHCATCPRCKGIYEEAQRSLSILKQPAPEIHYLSPEKELSIVSSALEQSRKRSTARIIAFPKRGFLYAAAAALVICAVTAGVFLNGVHFGKHPFIVSVVSRPAPERFANLTKDTTVMFNGMCALRVAAGADVSIRHAAQRVVHFTLGHGRILIAARKGLYDTLAVDCRLLTVLATGTHFSVSISDSSVSVSVLEGTVKLLHPLARSTKSATTEVLLSSLEICSANDVNAEVPWKKERMPEDLQNQLMENFAAMDNADVTAFTSPVIGDTEDIPRKSPISTTTGTYGNIRKLMRNGDYEKAIDGLISLLKTRLPDPDIAYCDLALCYSKTDQWDNAVDAYAKAAGVTNDSLVREAILHRTNHILFSKLFRYDDAEKGIRTYLDRYPRGTWRERELGLLARVERARKKNQ
jgi:ferric-dicitrate binding protein FerR (iron transport regulator)